MLRIAVVLVASLVSAMAADDWAAALRPPATAKLADTQEFVFSNESEPETLDPNLMTGVLESRLGGALFEGLTTLDPRTLQVRPALAERWEVSDDQLTYTFHLRPATWSDGTALTSADVVASWRRVLTPKTAAAYAYQLYPLAGAEDFHHGKATDFAQVGVSAPDERTVVTRLKQPCPWWLDLCAFHTLMPVPMHVIDAAGDRWERAGTMVSNGPFTLREWTPRSRIVLAKNPRYWDAASVRLERVVALPVQDNDTALRLYRDGQLHWLPKVPQLKLDEVRRDPDYYATPYFGTHFYRFNCARPPFDRKEVRQAFVKALDRAAIATQVLRAGELPAGGLCPAIGQWEPPAAPAPDRDAARELLAKAGYADGAGFPSVDILFNTDERHQAVAEAAAAQWRAALQVVVGLRNSEWKSYLHDQDQLEFAICRSSWIGDYGDPNTFFDLFVTGGGNNRTGWSNAAYDDLVRRSQAEPDPGARRALFAELEAILAEECPIVPIAYYVNQGLLRETVGGWWPNVRDVHPLKYVWIEQ